MKITRAFRTLLICIAALICLMVVWMGSVSVLGIFMYNDWRILFLGLVPAGIVAFKILNRIK